MSGFTQTIWRELENTKNDSLPGIYHPLIERILVARGVVSSDEMIDFMSARPQKTYDPYLMKGMHNAVKRIKEALENNEKIVFYGDYDVDGVTSVALLTDFFYPITKQIEFYIPLRNDEGYGLHRDAIEEIKEEYHADLLMTVDCGISSIDEVGYANELGLDVIITDHHLPGNEIPDCIVLNPKQPGCQYPFKELCGCGVAFKLIQALQQELSLSKSHLAQMLDLVAMATVCDVVPLIDENRTFVKYGLERIRQKKRVGLNTLIRQLSLKQEGITARDLGFVIGPHFNAAGRIDDARSGVRLLVTKDANTAEEISHLLCRLNSQRRHIQDDGLLLCSELVEERHQLDPFLVVSDSGLHEGVIGIIAGRLRDRYFRPVIILTSTSDPDVYTGSGRSVPGFHLYHELSTVAHLFEKYGGHASACGLKIRKEHINELRDVMIQRVLTAQNEDPDLLQQQIIYVSEMKPGDIAEDLIQQLSFLEPHGMGNPRPCFCMKGLRVNGDSRVRVMGHEKQHIKINQFVFDELPDNSSLEIIGFNLGVERMNILRSYNGFDLLFVPQVNEFNGKRSIQMVIKDVRQ